MKNKHIINIGLPRCATTWLWNNLTSHPALNNPQYDKENPIMLGDAFDSYSSFYSRYPISANFNTNLYIIDTELIKQIGQVTTHISFLIRNPYEWIERYHDFLSHNQSIIDFVINFRRTDYRTICKRWIINVPPDTKFKVLYYDDIMKNSKQFLSDYFDFCGLDVILKSDFDNIANASTQKTRTKLNFSTNEKKIINNHITEFSEFVGKDLMHWCR